MLEHLEPHEVDAAVGELTRVARHFLYLKIAMTVGQRDHDLAKLAREGNRVPKNLHATVWPLARWIRQFERFGFSLHHSLEDTAGYLWLRRWPHMCCSVVLARRGTPMLPPGADEARSKHLQSVWWGARAMPGRSTSTTRPTNARDV